jgi:hypothetical protein
MFRVIAVIAILCTAPLSATVVLPADFREVVAGSQVIVHGRVVDVRAEWLDGRRRIESIVTIEAGTYLKGGPGERVTIRVDGGQIGRYKSVTLGAPEFAPGDEAVFFLTSRGPSMARIFGLGQGVFRVRTDAGGRRMVVQPALLSHGSAPVVLRRGDPDRRALPLEAFAVQVRDVMAQAAGGAR